MVARFRPTRIRARIGSSPTDRQYGLQQSLASQFAQLTKQMTLFAEHMKVQSPEILMEALRPTFAKSQEYCPKKTGALRNSGYLESRRTGDRIEVEIGYGRNGNPHYATVVHEVPNYHAAPTRWKWLQAALQEDDGLIQQRIIDGYREASGV